MAAGQERRQPGTHPRRYRDVASARRNIHFGGAGLINGTVKEKGQPDQPLVRQVLLYSENTHTLVAEAWSDAAGNYRFEWLDPAPMAHLRLPVTVKDPYVDPKPAS